MARTMKKTKKFAKTWMRYSDYAKLHGITRQAVGLRVKNRQVMFTEAFGVRVVRDLPKRRKP